MSATSRRYRAEINLVGVNDAHVLALGRVPANSRVLDLGAADGSMAAALRDMGCRAWGVELDPEAAELAAPYCEDLAVADLNDLDLAQRFAGQQFDIVLMLDVLEHLTDPAAVLRGVGAVLAPGGWGVISLPNIAHVSTRLALLEGRFTYTDTGLLDRTHLRFFDRAGVDRLLADSGWAMFDLERVTRRLGTTEIRLDHPNPDLVAQIEADEEGLTYQFVISGAPLGSPVLNHTPTLPAMVAQSTLLGAISYIENLEGQLRTDHIPALYSELERLRLGSLDRRRQLQQLLQALQENNQRLELVADGKPAGR
ncbi:MAG: class I SAM-dependent methyltransferase [Actinomycetota bacterium]|nr:class I SAM-dependent methyltransferase [Actinomycetota bacterium]